MVCCGNNEVEPEDEEDLLEGPMENRSCTDVIFFVLFAAFLVGMFFLFGVGISRGNPGRVLYGTDVVGDVCGMANEPIKIGDIEVPNSGKNLEKAKFLFFDISKTAAIVAKLAGDNADSQLTDLVDATGGASFSGTPREYCISGGAAALHRAEHEVTSIALTPDMDAETKQRVRRISKQLQTEAECRRAVRLKRSLSRTWEEGRGEEGGSVQMRGFLLNARLCHNRVNSTAKLVNAEEEERESRKIEFSKQELSNLTNPNSSMILVVLEPEGRLKVWRTSGLNTEQATQLMDLNPVNVALTGGGACRRCVEDCPDGYKNFLSRCIPDAVTDQANVVGGLFSSSGAESFFEELMGDLQNCGPQIGQMGVVALVFSLIITLLFRFLAGFIVYAIIGILIVALVGGTITLWVLWYLKNKDIGGDTSQIDSAINAAGANATLENSFLASVEASNEEEVMYFLIGAIVSTVVLAVVLLILFILRKRINLVIHLFQEAGHAVHAMPLLVLVPLLTFLALALTTAIWIYGTLWIFTAGDPVEDSGTKFIKFTPDTFLWWMRWYHVFGFLWITQFCIACQHLVIAGSVAGWYFSKDKSSVGVSTIVSAFYRLLRFHLGTAAFGSLIIAIIQMIRIVLKYLEHKVKDWEKKGCNGPLIYLLKAFLKCAQCVLWCFEKCMKFININAYIETAIYGYNFCRAAMKAFQMLTSNALRVAAINSVGTFVLLLGKLAVVIATVAVSYEIMRIKTETVYVAHPWAPILIAACFSYLTAHCFIAVYGMAIDTIFLCFCEDSARNDGITRPYYMSKGMMEFVENSDKALAALEKRDAAKQQSNEVMVMENRSDSLTSIDDY